MNLTLPEFAVLIQLWQGQRRCGSCGSSGTGVLKALALVLTPIVALVLVQCQTPQTHTSPRTAVDVVLNVAVTVLVGEA